MGLHIITTLVASIIFFFINVHIMKEIIDNNLKISFHKFYLYALLFCILISFNYIWVPSGIKIVVGTFILMIMFRILFPQIKWNIVVTCSIICQSLTLLSESTFAILTTIIFDMDQSTIVNNVFGTLASNVIIACITFLLIKIKIIKNFCRNVVKKSEDLSDKKIIILIVILITIINLLLITIYYRLNLIYLICINSLFVIFIAWVTYKLLDEKNKLFIQTNKTLQYKAENDALINNLHEYEKLADQHRLLNHENKNQLLAIKQMINNNEDGVISYIDNLLKTKVPDNQSLLSKTKRIPSGGLQGIIYQKMLLMKKTKITYSLNISRELKSLDFKKLDIDSNIDLCKIVGVFLDNAIEEVKTLKEKIIGVELYVEDDKLCIGITNTYGKNKDFSKLDEIGYTTKGEGHGYGLSLVRELLKKNKRFENTRSVTGKYFTQVIKVSDMKHDYE